MAKKKIFISWSGEAAKHLAEGLKRTIFSHPALVPWVSSQDIMAGDLWFNAVKKELAGAHYGIGCLTSDGLSSVWVNFEAGYLFSRLDNFKVLLFHDVEPRGPLSHLQIKQMTGAGRPAFEAILKEILDNDVEASQWVRRTWQEWEEVLQTLPEKRSSEANRKTRLLGRRNGPEALEAMKTIIRRVRDSSAGSLHVLAIAHTDIFNTGAQLSDSFSAMLQAEKPARILFLNPASEAAATREKFETNRENPAQIVPTRQIISQLLTSAREQWAAKRPNLSVQTYNDPPAMYLLFDDEEMIVHPYFNSVTGHCVEAMLVSRGSDTYAAGREHFTNLWASGDSRPQ